MLRLSRPAERRSTKIRGSASCPKGKLTAINLHVFSRNGVSPMSHHRFVCAAACVLGVTLPSACTTPPRVGSPVVDFAGDWPSYNRTRYGDRYSPLSEINTGNVAQLRTICTYMLPEVTALQTGPIVINGTMYFTTDTISYAINASNCAEKWKAVRHGETPSGLGVHRGFAYMNGVLFRGTSDVHV